MEENKKEIIHKMFETFNQFSKLNKNHSPVPELKSSEIFVLFSIKNLVDTENTGVKVSDISRVLSVSAPTVTQLINGLVESGHVERSINKEDRRAVQITLTEKSEIVVQKALKAFYGELAKLVDYLGVEKSSKLIELMSMVYSFYKDKNEF